tara:strand:+ start:331 stop:519 length:189 start_codon:yes stop_codon:yes gene_type:complete
MDRFCTLQKKTIKKIAEQIEQQIIEASTSGRSMTIEDIVTATYKKVNVRIYNNLKRSENVWF